MRTVNTGLLVAIALLAGAILNTNAWGHCEIPCGIYGDRMRIDMLEEHCQTIEKSMQQIAALKTAPSENANQLVRWVVNKEEHANTFQNIVYQYFMNQRITPVAKSDAEAYEAYVTQLTLLHRMLVTAMKCKQSTDLQDVQTLRTLVADFDKAYFKAHDHH